MPDNQIDVYLPHGSDSFSDMVRVVGRADGKVRFYREGGGKQVEAPEQEFDTQYRFVDGNEMRRLSLRFKPIFVDGNWDGGRVVDGEFERAEIKPLPAWSNGTVWNGFATPVFSKDTILSPEGDESFRNAWNWCVHDEDRNVFVMVSSHTEEMQIDADTDFSVVLAEAAASGKGVFDTEFLGAVREINVYQPLKMTLPDASVVEGFGIGSYSWTWFDVTDEVANEPTAPAL